MLDASIPTSGLVLFCLGVILLVFRAPIGRFYDLFPLTEEERQHYRRVVLPMVGVLMTIGGLFIAAVELVPPTLSAEDKDDLRQFFEGLGIPTAIGVAFVSLGIICAAALFTKRVPSAKLEIFRRTYGRVPGTVLWFMSYVATPVGVGAYLMLRD